MSWVDHKAEYEEISRSIDPAVRLVTKDAWPWKVLAALVMVFTFGGISYRKFLEGYATTIGPIQGYPRKALYLSRSLLIHEARHTRQARWFGLWSHPWVGLPLFAVFYLLLPLPLGLAWFRFRFELDAHVASWRWMLANGAPEDSVMLHADYAAKRVCGGNYGWSWPQSWGWETFIKKARQIIEEHNGLKT
jgi:hypothetical protein